MNKQKDTDSPLSRSIKNFYLHSLGCSKNQVDGEEIIALLSQKGYLPTENPEDADLIIVNTCGFIQPAKEESINETLLLRKRYPDKKILLAGCLAQRYGDDLFRDLSEVDGVVGNRDLSKVLESVEDLSRGIRSIKIPEWGSVEVKRTRFLNFPASAYVKIAEGCDNHCTYCAIPLIRGNLKSRNRDSIVQEIRELKDQGISEVNLIAQDIASYGKDVGGPGLFDLLTQIAKFSEGLWIRLLYLHPDNFPLEILPLCGLGKPVLPYFDIPFQHSSKRMLSRMGRRGEGDTYLKLLDKIRSSVPEVVVRSTFLIGFPGEEREDHLVLQDFIGRAALDWAGFFTYSKEEGTPASGYKASSGSFSSKASLQKRMKELNSLQTGISEKRMERFSGMELEVLIEELFEDENLSLGRGYLQAPEVDGAIIVQGIKPPGTRVRCKIVKRNNLDLEAVLL